MQLKPLTNGRVSGTGTVPLNQSSSGGMLGAVAISTDGTNLVTVTLRKLNASGEITFDFQTITSQMVIAPVDIGATAAIYYSITGTGGSAMLYEWVA